MLPWETSWSRSRQKELGDHDRFVGHLSEIHLQTETLRRQITDCAGRLKDRSKQLVDRDLNAAANILLVGTSDTRPSILCRGKKRTTSDESASDCNKMIKLSVDAERSSSDPAPLERSGELLSIYASIAVEGLAANLLEREILQDSPRQDRPDRQ